MIISSGDRYYSATCRASGVMNPRLKENTETLPLRVAQGQHDIGDISLEYRSAYVRAIGLAF
jgi:hypothetical protein